MVLSEQASKGTVWGAAGVVLAAVGILGTISFNTMTQQWATAKTLGEYGVLLQGVARLEEKTAGLARDVDGIQRHLVAQSFDPKELLARSKLPIDKDIDVIAVEGNVVFLPQTADARARLLARGLRHTQFTPVFGGFTADAATAAAVNTAIESAMATGMTGSTLQ